MTVNTTHNLFRPNPKMTTLILFDTEALKQFTAPGAKPDDFELRPNVSQALEQLKQDHYRLHAFGERPLDTLSDIETECNYLLKLLTPKPKPMFPDVSLLQSIFIIRQDRDALYIFEGHHKISCLTAKHTIDQSLSQQGVLLQLIYSSIPYVVEGVIVVSDRIDPQIQTQLRPSGWKLDFVSAQQWISSLS